MLAKPPFPVLDRGHPLARELLFALPCYEGAGTTLHDLSGGGNDATLNSGVSWSAGQFGWCPVLNGSTGFGLTPSFTLPNYGQVLVSCLVNLSAITASARYTVLDTSGTNVPIMPQFEVAGMLAGAGTAYLNVIVPGTFLIQGGGTGGGGDYNPVFTARGLWTHVFWWVDNSTTTAGVGWNGQIIATKNYGSISFGSGAEQKYIGERSTGGQQFPGAIDGLVVYNLPPGSNVAALAAALYYDSFAMYRPQDAILKSSGGTAFQPAWATQSNSFNVGL